MTSKWERLEQLEKRLQTYWEWTQATQSIHWAEIQKKADKPAEPPLPKERIEVYQDSDHAQWEYKIVLEWDGPRVNGEKPVRSLHASQFYDTEKKALEGAQAHVERVRNPKRTVVAL